MKIVTRHVKRSLLGLACVAVPLALLGAGFATEPPAATRSAAPAAPDAYATEIRPLLDKYCAGCHGAQNPSGGVRLTGYATVPALQRDPATWRRAITQVRERSMPPRGMPQPTQAERERLADWLDATLRNTPDALLPKDPGRVLIHRLSRTEYNNTIRDLLGVDTHPADRFPADGGGGGGFDNNADTLFVPPILMERYLQAAGDVLDAARPERLFGVRPSKTLSARAAARQIVASFATRAYRRPVEPPELARLMTLYDGAAHRGAPFDAAVKRALKAVLVSPSFLFRIEKDRPAPGAYPVEDYALASRLSYFLWSSMPDDALLKLAREKRLRDSKILEQQVRRMLRSPKSRALADSFAGQWLRVRDLYTTAQPDPKRFPGFTPVVRDAAYNETITFFHDLLRANGSVLRLLDADYTFLNGDLARYYGIEGVSGPEMRRVALKDRRRGGVLTMASVLTLTSYPQRTSPVLRGKWVLEEILGTPPPPPPPGAGGLPASDAPKDGETFRQRLEKHREKPECASCHSRMDPIGFGLENFDATGRWRDAIENVPVDARGTLANGETFEGPVALKKHLLTRKTDFVHNLAEKMLAYALGRGLEPYDIPAVRRIVAQVERDGYRSDTLVLEIVRSYPFQYRKSR